MSRFIQYYYNREDFETARAECRADQSENLFYSTSPDSFNWGFETHEYKEN